MPDVLATEPGLDSGLIRKESASLRGNERVEALVNDPEHITVNGEEYHYKNFIGIGHLNVDTGRGEVKAWPNDFIVDLGPDVNGVVRKIVLPPEIFSAWFTYVPDAPVAFKDIRMGKEIPPAYNDYLNAQVLNNKSGPDKYMQPVEALGQENFPPDPSSAPASSSSSSTRVREVPVPSKKLPEVPAEVASIREKKNRGEKLTGDEQAKLVDWDSKARAGDLKPKADNSLPESKR